MQRTLEKVIINHKKGVFLFDPPTGFGKTTIVLQLIKRFLQGDKLFEGVKRIFFLTNLLTNLPYNELLEELTEEEKSKCFRARATVDYVLQHFLTISIENSEITKSKEYIELREDIETYNILKEKLETDPSDKKLRKSVKNFRNKISNGSEPTFRNFIRTRFFFNKSAKEKREFIDKNGWFRKIYPICDLEKYSVIFLSTKKFVSLMNTFRRMPFYIYSDDIRNESIVFIDEFDATKRVLLKQIIDDGLINKVDVIRLFINIHLSLQSVQIPKKLYKVTEYNKEKVESGDWYTTENHIEYNKTKFKEIYDKYNIEYLIKSIEMDYKKLFLFDDGKYFNIIKDSSKKFIYTRVDKNESQLSLYGNKYELENKQINYILRDLEYCINTFIKSLFYIANNFLYYKNVGKGSEATRYTLEEALYSVLDVFNLDEESKKYLYTQVTRRNFDLKKIDTDIEARKGFNFTEIEDSNYHDMKSVIHTFDFNNTPEDIILKLAEKALVIGISATANIETCIGNYDLKYLRTKLQEKCISPDDEDKYNIKNEFESIKSKFGGQFTIHTQAIDDIDMFSCKEKCQWFIHTLFASEHKNYYLQLLENINRDEYYYFLMELKLAYLYREVGTKEIYSFVAFLNAFPKKDYKFNIERLENLFKDIAKEYNFDIIVWTKIDAGNFDFEFKKAKTTLEEGKKVFIITTYQTIGSGKNIQYKIPESLKNNVLVSDNDNQGTKDFDAIYLSTPTNLTQNLYFCSENKYEDLSKYLFEQEYLYKNKQISYYQMKNNIINAFRAIFFKEQNSLYTRNGDLYLHTTQIAVQAVGRICRCRSKNKNIYLYADTELIDRLLECKKKVEHILFNDEFLALYGLRNKADKSAQYAKYSEQNKKAFGKITNAAYTVRNSAANVSKWNDLRDYVLKNPTVRYPKFDYKDLYFDMEMPCSGYSFKRKNYNIVDLKIDTRYDGEQVSEQACDLPVILSIDIVKKLFEEKGYAKMFLKEPFIMCPSLFYQVYKGALGEVVGTAILEHELGWDLEELENISFYEFFDFKLGNIYFDFKHWDEFQIDNDTYVKKIESKLAKINGAKCFVINLIKRNDANPKINMGDTVVQIPFLIDGDNSVLNHEALKYIDELYNQA